MKKRDVILNTEEHRSAFNEFADALQEANREGWRSSETLRYFIDASFLALRGGLLSGEPWVANEAEYMTIVKSCQRPKETMSALAHMFAATARALQTAPIDFIGPVFSVLSADGAMGQFFTPYTLSRVIAEMTFGEDPRKMAADGTVLRLCEPSCGVGGMILASNEILRGANIDVAREAHWTAIDIDSRAHRACYIQLALTDCSADVYRGNALGDPDKLVGVRTPAAVAYPKHPNPPPTVGPGVQLSLF